MTTTSARSRSRSPLSIAALAAALAASPLAAQTLRVSPYGADSNPGYTWGTSLRTLREALSRAAADPAIDRIEVGAGTYKPGGSRGIAFELRSGLTIVGGYPAAGGSAPDADANPTILSGDIGVAGDSSDNSYSVLVALGVTDVRLEGLRIRHGNADEIHSGGPMTYGGGIYAQGSTILFLDCRFHHNQARYGGAVGLVSSAVTFSGCRFDENFAMSGGAIYNTVYNQAGDVLIDRCRFLGNFAAGSGGAIENHTVLAAYDAEFSGNQATQSGGAILCATPDHSTRVSNCSFANNQAGLAGGALCAADPGVTVLVNSIFWDDLGGGSPTEIAPAGVFAHHCDVLGLAACGLSGYSNFEADPRFADALGADGAAGTADDDLHLRRSSPCLQVGDSGAVPIFAMRDIDDEARIQRPMPWLPAIVDVGADEVGPLVIGFVGTTSAADLRITVDGAEDGVGDTDTMVVPGGSRLAAVLQPLDPGVVGLPAALTLDVFAGGVAPSLPGMPGAWFGPGAIVLLVPALPAQGLPVVIDPFPHGMPTLMLQGHVLDLAAANGLFDSTRGRELRPQ